MTLKRDDFFKERPREYRDVEIPELGGTVKIRKMTAGERAKYESSVWDKNGNRIAKAAQTYRERLAVLTACDHDGQPLFTSADVDRLSQLDATILDKIADAALKLAGIRKDDTEPDEGNLSAQTDG